MKYCKNCTNALFNKLFGEYKCDITHVSVNSHFTKDCPDYEKGNPTVSKDLPENYIEEEE